MDSGTPNSGGLNEWRQHAACRHMDVALFFPEAHNNAPAAVAVCRECPVREECLTYALDNMIHNGIWGGTGERQRREMRRKRDRMLRCAWCRRWFSQTPSSEFSGTPRMCSQECHDSAREHSERSYRGKDRDWPLRGTITGT